MARAPVKIIVEQVVVTFASNLHEHSPGKYSDWRATESSSKSGWLGRSAARAIFAAVVVAIAAAADSMKSMMTNHPNDELQ